jgi:hypothetical protein
MAQCVARPLSRCGLSLGLLCGMVLPAWAGAAGPGSRAMTSVTPGADAGTSLDFDIPAQPLMTALDRYASTTHLSIVAPSEMVRDRKSPAVSGRLSPDAALRQLLSGTGLTAVRQVDKVGTTYYLKELTVVKEANAPAVSHSERAALFGHPAYAALVQSRIWQALCANARTAPDRHRMAFRFQIDAAGHVANPRLFATTGDSQRDALRGVRLDAPPSALAQQFLLMSVVPKGPADPHHCEPGAH